MASSRAHDSKCHWHEMKGIERFLQRISVPRVVNRKDTYTHIRDWTRFETIFENCNTLKRRHNGRRGRDPCATFLARSTRVYVYPHGKHSRPPRSITASANARNKNEPKRRTIFAFYHSSVTMSLSKWSAMAMNEATAHARPAFSVSHPTWFIVVSAIDFEIGSKEWMEALMTRNNFYVPFFDRQFVDQDRKSFIME